MSEDINLMLENYKIRYRELVDKSQTQRAHLLEALNLLNAITTNTNFISNIKAAEKAIDDAKVFLKNPYTHG